MEQMRKTLSDVNDWVKFSEAKNGALLAASGVGIWGCLRTISLLESTCWITIYLVAAALFLLCGFVTSLISFLPILDAGKGIPKKAEPVQPTNLLYFGHLAFYPTHELARKFYDAQGESDHELTEMDLMCAEQIAVNSRIALAKLSLFNLSVTFLLTGILTPAVAWPLLYALRARRRR